MPQPPAKLAAKQRPAVAAAAVAPHQQQPAVVAAVAAAAVAPHQQRPAVAAAAVAPQRPQLSAEPVSFFVGKIEKYGIRFSAVIAKFPIIAPGKTCQISLCVMNNNNNNNIN